MKHKNLLKIFLDIVMVVLFALMFNTNASGLAFHEIGGLALFLLFAVHLVINRKQIGAALKKLFSTKGGSARLWVNYILNAVLLAGFAAVLLSGVLMSKVVFPAAQYADGAWRTVHLAASLAMILATGAHIGLHWEFIKTTVKKYIRLPRKVGMAIAAVLMAAVILFGGYAAVTDGARMAQQVFQSGTYGHGGEFRNGSGELALNNAAAQDESTEQTGNSATQDNNAQGEGKHLYGRGFGNGDGSGRGLGLGDGHGRNAGGDIGAMSVTSLSWLSMSLLVGLITAATARFAARRKTAA